MMDRIFLLIKIDLGEKLEIFSEKIGKIDVDSHDSKQHKIKALYQNSIN
jgi:hypothetical protein